MKYLLDTHVFIWLDIAPQNLSQPVQTILQEPHNEIFLSLVSVWEMQIKMRLGKLTLQNSLKSTVQTQQKNGIQLLNLSLRHIYHLDRLAILHKDPFDHLLIAQATSHKLTFITDDQKIQQYSALNWFW
jgi:PIN domain nuclease of toxin-antitoxin system